MKERLVQFIAAFQRHGPGRTKLIRLYLDGAVGPMVTLNHCEANSEKASGETGDGKDAFALSAERTLQQAYVFPRNHTDMVREAVASPSSVTGTTGGLALRE